MHDAGTGDLTAARRQDAASPLGQALVTVIEHGTCVSHRERTREPRVTITAHPADFLRLITRNASGPVLFMTGKVKINGDLGFAAGLTTLFDLPRG